MPKHGHFAEKLSRLGPSSFGKAPFASDPGRRPAKLHIGDSVAPPTHGVDLDPSFLERHPHWFQYPSTMGVGKLRDAIADFYTDSHGLDTEREEILVSSGSTGAISGLLDLLCDDGDEIVVPTPAWPLILGMARLSRAELKEVELYTDLGDQPQSDIESRLESAITPRTAVLYLNSPNNPSGKVLNTEQRAAILRVAERHDLWVLSDEAYDGMAFDGRTTPPLAAECASPTRVITTSTFSKIHRAAGLRLGWVRADRGIIDALDRILTHQTYSASALSQSLMIEPMRTRTEWSGHVLADFQRRRDLFLKALDLPISTPEGTYFCFFDVRPFTSCSVDEIVARCAANSVGVTHGREFGLGFETWIRVCFASENEQIVEESAYSVRRAVLG